jgi:hypothetical protein
VADVSARKSEEWRRAASLSRHERSRAENVDIALLAKFCQDTLAEIKAIRHDLAAVQQLAVKTVDVLVKMEQRNEMRFNSIEARLVGLDERLTRSMTASTPSMTASAPSMTALPRSITALPAPVGATEPL